MKLKRLTTIAALVLISVTVNFLYASAEEKRDMQGWEIGSPYNKLYDVREFEKIRAYVIRVPGEPGSREVRCPCVRARTSGRNA